MGASVERLSALGTFSDLCGSSRSHYFIKLQRTPLTPPQGISFVNPSTKAKSDIGSIGSSQTYRACVLEQLGKFWLRDK